MSANVVAGYKNPTGKPHPAMKLTMLVALLAVVFLGVPRGVVASPPTVQAPTGTMSGGVFTGPYTFNTYIYCSSGLTLTGSYTGNLDGTHYYVFSGAPDGSLLVSVDGSGEALLTSCGDPFATPSVVVASYTTNKNNQPSPTPTPTPTPAPTPTPTPAPTSSPTPSATPVVSSGGSKGTGGTPTPISTTPSPTPSPSASAEPTASPSPQTVPLAGKSSTPPQPGAPVQARAGMKLAGVLPWLVLLLAIVSLAVLFWRSQAARDWIVGTAFVVNLRLRPRLFRLKMWIKRFLRIQGRELPKRRGLSAHHHSGKVLAHHHTSYASLAFLLMISTVLLAAYSATSRADVSSSQLLTFTVLGPPPTSVPTIDQPVSGDHTTSSLITVQGTCDSQLLVELYRNGSFAGSIACSSGGTYSLLASLVNGQNDLTVRHVDGLGQAGPSSAVVSVFYDAPPPPTPTPTPSATPTPTPSSSVAPVSPTPVATNRPAASATPRPTAAPAAPPLTIDSDQHYYQGGQPGSPIDITITVKGGYGPYSTSWDWGDGSEQSIATSNGKAVASHAYKGGGMYRLVIRAEDSRHHEAVITLQVIVNGGAAAGVVGQAGGGELSGNLMIAWPLLAMVILMVASFWLGENHRLAQVRFARLRQRRLSPGIA